MGVSVFKHKSPVDRQHLPRNKGRSGKIDQRLGDVLRPAVATDQILFGKAVKRLLTDVGDHIR